MKKFVLPLFSCLLVLSLLLGSFTTAKAAPGDDPVVTPVSGDTDFTTEVIAIASLPGTTVLDEMIVPVGFPDGEAQFGGNGILVKGFDSGKATACFSLSATAVNEGWGGKVAVWNGAKWVRLATSITIEDETNTALACATITGNGTYAFIKYVTEPDKLPGYGKCSDDVGADLLLAVDFPDGILAIYAAAVFHTPSAPVGSTIRFEVLSAEPEGLILSGSSGSGIVEDSYGDISVAYASTPIIFTFDNSVDYDDVSVTVRIYMPDCYADTTFPDDFELTIIGIPD